MRVLSSDDWHDYDAAAAAFLDRDPVANTIALTVLDTLRHDGAFGDEPPWFSWAVDDTGEVRGVASRTPPHAVGLPPTDVDTATALGRANRDRELPGANGPEPAVRAFAAGAGRTVEVRMTELQYVLTALTEPPPVGGGPRPFTDDDVDRYSGWMDGFVAETGVVRGDPVRSLRTRLAAGGALALWCVDGEPVAMASRSPAVAGVPRIGPVWTQPEHRGRGYGAAVTAHVCREALAAGATACTLFADAANPTSNGVYRRLGFDPVGTIVEAVFSG
jgi:GNAT superfamily N-acetyltransferase